MKQHLRSINLALIAALVGVVSGIAPQARADDLPLAQKSPLTGVAFEDLPFQLPVERNFQMALLGVSSGIGRSCGKMEAYGWRMDQSEQERVNRIFKSTVERLSAAGYTVTPESVKGQTKDITLFTADSNNKHFMYLWSAADRGLVLNVCETNQPISATHRHPATPSVEVFPLPTDPPPPTTLTLIKSSKPGKFVGEKFSPTGKWIGGYKCDQGYTGGTLTITSMSGENFKGKFEFYPTERNRAVPGGSYEVYGQYDKGSRRILINPGRWIKRPKGFFNTVIVGSFDAAQNSFSGLFQGIKGCTSFEARRNGVGAKLAKKVTEPKTLATESKKKAKKVKKPKAGIAPASNSLSTQDAIPPADVGIVVTPSGAPLPTTVTDPAPKAAAPAPAPALATDSGKPAPTGTSAPAASAAPVTPAPALQPTTVAPVSDKPAIAPAARTLPVGKIPPGTVPAFVPPSPDEAK